METLHRISRRRHGLVLLVVAVTACATDGPSRTQATPTPHGVSEAAVVRELQIVCTADGGTRLPAGTTVAAQPDGVHLRVDNRTREGASINGTGVDVEPGTSTHVADVAPGAIDLACWRFSDHEEPKPPTARVRVVDPHGHWVSQELDCARNGMVASQINDFAFGAPGDDANPVAQARREAGADLHDADFVRAGYPADETPVVIARHDGRTVAAYQFHRAQGGTGWLLGGIDACA